METGVKLFTGMLLVHLLALERKLKGNIPSQHSVMTRLVERVADIVTKYTQGADGRTGYERLFGKQVHEEGLEFGERVLWRKHRSNDTNVVVDARSVAWSSLGATHHRVAVNDEVLEVRAVQRRPLTERWCRESLGNIRGLFQMSNQLQEYRFNQSLPQEECTSAMLTSRSGVTHPVVGDACR